MNRARQFAQLVVGLVVTGVGIGAYIRARLGLAPWDVLHQGISKHTGIPIGTVTILVGVPILLAWWPLRQRPGIGTIVNVLLIGSTVDVTLALWPTMHGLGARVACLVGGLGLLAVGVGMYIAADLGPGPRDGVMTGLHHRLGWSIRLSRTLLETSAFGAGLVLGGQAGIGTVLFAFGFGPLVQVTLRWFGYPVRTVEVLGDEPLDAVGLAGE